MDFDIKKFLSLLALTCIVMIERAWVATVLWWMLGQPYTHVALPFGVAIVGSIIFTLISYTASVENISLADMPNSIIKTLILYELLHPITLLLFGALVHLFI